MSGTTTERRKRFEYLIEQAEQELAENPVRYTRKLGFLACLGYVYLFGALIVFIGGVGGLGYLAVHNRFVIYLLFSKKLILGVLFLAYGFVKAFWVKIDPPEGYEVTRDQCPELFDEIDKIQSELKTPPIHKIILTTEFNAAISQTPRLGVLGWTKNTLILGVSLLLTLPKDRIRAVIAHELGHLSHNHSRFRGWIYRVRISWLNVMEAFDSANSFWSELFFGKFFDWYAPYFSAYSFALARANEYEADAAAADATSKNLVAEGLIQIHVEASLVGKHYWDKVYKDADETPKINSKVFTSLKQFLEKQPFSKQEKVEALKASLKEKPDHTDTHPVLKDRLRPLIPKIEQLYAPGFGGGSELLAPSLGKILKDFDRNWAMVNKDRWKERYQYVAESRKNLKALEEKKSDDLSNDELWNLAYWSEEFKPDRNPLPYYKAFWDKNQEDPAANLSMGRLLLDKEDKRGISFLNRAMLANPRYIVTASELAYAFYHRAGNQKEAQRYLLKAERQMDIENQGYQERNYIYDEDVCKPHRLTPEQIEYLRKQWLVIKGIKHMWICEKKIRVYPDDAVFIVAYAASGFFPDEDNLTQEIVNQQELLNDFFVLYDKGDWKSIAKTCKSVGEQIF